MTTPDSEIEELVRRLGEHLRLDPEGRYYKSVFERLAILARKFGHHFDSGNSFDPDLVKLLPQVPDHLEDKGQWTGKQESELAKAFLARSSKNSDAYDAMLWALLTWVLRISKGTSKSTEDVARVIRLATDESRKEVMGSFPRARNTNIDYYDAYKGWLKDLVLKASEHPAIVGELIHELWRVTFPGEKKPQQKEVDIPPTLPPEDDQLTDDDPEQEEEAETKKSSESRLSRNWLSDFPKFGHSFNTHWTPVEQATFIRGVDEAVGVFNSEPVDAKVALVLMLSYIGGRDFKSWWSGRSHYRFTLSNKGILTITVNLPEDAWQGDELLNDYLLNCS